MSEKGGSGGGTAVVVVPTQLEEVTPGWLSSILNRQVSSTNFQLEQNVQAGSGFLSNMVRVSCQASPTAGAEEEESLHLIVKLLPTDPGFRTLVISEEFDRTEVEFYSKVIPDLLAIVPQLGNYLCPFYYGQMGVGADGSHASVLVLQDLKPQGYFTIPFEKEETEEEMEEVLHFLALLHFGGRVLEEGRGPLNLHYDFLQGTDPNRPSVFYQMAEEGFKVLNSLLKDVKDGAVLRSYQALASFARPLIQAVQREGGEMPCLIHGDLWSNNLLFNSDPSCPTKVIDWQLLGYKDATFDVTVTILSSLPAHKLSRENVERLARSYYASFLAAAAVGREEATTGLLVRRSWEEFVEFLFGWGMSYALLWFLMSPDPFASDFPKLINIYSFLVSDLKVPEFLLAQLNKVKDRT